ncbi:hypothetical protein Thpro_022106 [Acidihalobacter prosperus]|uniref:Uncharacterized protein n=2 Tax=Acidihalobacter prosperus TaxID=160660 RepID=A0A1A6C356_9GAMM|nr:hypothetical protein Thpro_022106 [Acidihalobacter prosperus]
MRLPPPFESYHEMDGEVVRRYSDRKHGVAWSERQDELMGKLSEFL